MINRVTSQSMMATAQRNLNAASSRMAEIQEKATSMQKISRPSDDPTGTSDSLTVRGEQARSAQYARNIDNGKGWMAVIESSMSLTTGLVNRAKDLALQGANGSQSDQSREALALELEGIRADLLAQANTTYLGRTVFAGNSDAGVAFRDGAEPVFTGSPGSAVLRSVGEGQTVRVDADGAAVFGTGADSVFRAIDDLAANLRANTNVSSSIGILDGHLKNIIAAHAEIGTRHARLERAEETNVDKQLTLEASRAGIEDADLAETALELQLQRINYEAALQVTAKVLPNSLMDFLR